MFPPERSAHTEPLPLTLPLSSAATPTAPAPSTSSFDRSSSNAIASLISSSVTSTISSRSTVPVARALGTRSYMRLNTRSKVLLPQPDGPMMAVIRFSGISKVTSCKAWNLP